MLHPDLSYHHCLALLEREFTAAGLVDPPVLEVRVHAGRSLVAVQPGTQGAEGLQANAHCIYLEGDRYRETDE